MNDSNPSVFPQFYERYDPIYSSKTWETRDGGITLRDYFAIEIAKSMIESDAVRALGEVRRFSPQRSYELADEMLKARAK